MGTTVRLIPGTSVPDVGGPGGIGSHGRRWHDAADVYRLSTPKHGLLAFLRYAPLAPRVNHQSLADDAAVSSRNGVDGEADLRHVTAGDRVAMMAIRSARGKE